MHFILNGGAYVNGIVAACDHQSSLYASCTGESIQHQETVKQRKQEHLTVQNTSCSLHQAQAQNGMMC